MCVCVYCFMPYLPTDTSTFEVQYTHQKRHIISYDVASEVYAEPVFAESNK